MRARFFGAIIATAFVSLVGGLVFGTSVLVPLLRPTPHPVGSVAPTIAAEASAAPTSLSGRADLGTPAPPIVSAAPTTAPGTPSPALPPAKPNAVPILYYHRIQAIPAGFAAQSPAQRTSFMAYNVLPSVFAAQLDWLAGHGYHTILPHDLVAHWDRGVKLPSRPIILTFDDGFAEWATNVVPLLESHHMVAEFYVSVDHIGPGSLTWNDLRAFAAAGMGIGAHDVHHVQLTGFGAGKPSASAATMWLEVSLARTIIGANTGVLPDSMAYVGGGFDATLVDLVRRAGYTSARSILRGVHQYPGWRFELRVSRIGGYDDVTSIIGGTFDPGLPTFARRVSGADPG